MFVTQIKIEFSGNNPWNNKEYDSPWNNLLLSIIEQIYYLVVAVEVQKLSNCKDSIPSLHS